VFFNTATIETYYLFSFRHWEGYLVGFFSLMLQVLRLGAIHYWRVLVALTSLFFLLLCCLGRKSGVNFLFLLRYFPA